MDYNWYLNAKNSYPDAIIFVRIGALYRTYDNDAIIVSEVLSTDPIFDPENDVNTIWILCFIMEGYVKKLKQLGHKVVLIEPVR